VRGSTFPGRRVSTHRHTCLRKASSAYAAPRCRVLPSLRARSASLSDAFLRVHRRLRDSSCRHATSSRTKSRDAVREGKRERCEGMPRTRLKRASHGCMYICTSRSGRRNRDLCTSSSPPTTTAPFFFFITCIMMSESARRLVGSTGSALKYNNLFSRVMEKRGTNFTVNRRTSRASAISTNARIILVFSSYSRSLLSLSLSLSLSDSSHATKSTPQHAFRPLRRPFDHREDLFAPLLGIAGGCIRSRTPSGGDPSYRPRAGYRAPEIRSHAPGRPGKNPRRGELLSW